ncbi:sterol carrier family protein [Brevibacterium jeotgali]|uniref:Bacterial SCP orthologue domain-containing protein n=1 Tax=Brevibacterium jeotgali TaxID=1262550 RepID=A0A2H1L4I0_9MICO|nr:sterol carrier family protein [Brevibacterium jeotgali]TWB98597.1 hypothetical protein FB108_2488 [Brevibacterium jeotgali]SMY11802.1 hypothetical protein BJEO58_01393 [Brevibacterium jeotgali]
MSAKRRTDPAVGQQALAAWCSARTCSASGIDRRTLATAVRYALEEFAARHPGGSVEVRVPPFGVTQAVAGPRHTRGTPPSTVESDPSTWLALVTGDADFAAAVGQNSVAASGVRSDISHLLPLFDAQGRSLG